MRSLLAVALAIYVRRISTRPFVGAYVRGPWSTAGALQLGKPDVIFLTFGNPTYDSSDGFNLEAGFRKSNTNVSLGAIQLAQANGAEVIASIGGFAWRGATAIALNQPKICTKFVSAISDLVQNTGVDGIEIAQIKLDGTEQGARVPFVVDCFRELRSALKEKKLAVALPATSPSLSNDANKHPRELIRLLAADKLVDWISITEYDTPRDSPILGQSRWNIPADIRQYIHDLQVAPNQLVLSLKPGFDEYNHMCTSAAKVLDLTNRTVVRSMNLRGVTTGFMDKDTPEYTGMLRDGGITYLARTALDNPQAKPSWWLPMACPVEIPISLSISHNVTLPTPDRFCTGQLLLDFAAHLKQEWDIICNGGETRILSITANCSDGDSHLLNLSVAFLNRTMSANHLTKIESSCFSVWHITNSSAKGLNYIIANNPGVFVNTTKTITSSELIADPKCPPCTEFCNFNVDPSILDPYRCPNDAAGSCIPQAGFKGRCICNVGFKGPDPGSTDYEPPSPMNDYGTLQPYCVHKETPNPPPSNQDWDLFNHIGVIAGILASLATTVFTIARTRSKLRKKAHTGEGNDESLFCCIQDQILRRVLLVGIKDENKNQEPLLNPVAQQTKLAKKDREIDSLAEENYRLRLVSGLRL
jgi:hypothetical protein